MHLVIISTKCYENNINANDSSLTAILNSVVFLTAEAALYSALCARLCSEVSRLLLRRLLDLLTCSLRSSPSLLSPPKRGLKFTSRTAGLKRGGAAVLGGCLKGGHRFRSGGPFIFWGVTWASLRARVDGPVDISESELRVSVLVYWPEEGDVTGGCWVYVHSGSCWESV